MTTVPSTGDTTDVSRSTFSHVSTRTHEESHKPAICRWGYPCADSHRYFALVLHRFQPKKTRKHLVRSTFSKLVSEHREHFLVHPQYSLFIPELEAKELNLVEEFKDAGMVYDSDHDGDEDSDDTYHTDTENDDADDDQDGDEDDTKDGDFLAQLRFDSDEARDRSARVQEADQCRAGAKAKKLKEWRQELRQERNALYDQQLEEYARK